MEEDKGNQGVAASPPGSQASPGADKSSPPSVSIPNAGDYVIFREWGINVRCVAKVTPKLIKLERGGFPHQISRDKVIAFTSDFERAKMLKQAIDGIDGEYNRRRNRAEEDYRERVRAAASARDKQISILVRGFASGIEAPSGDETPLGGSAEGESPTGEAGDAQ